MPSLRGNQSTSRTLNRLLLLNHLRRHGPTARSDIAAAIGLSPAAISYVSSELLEQQVIVETEAAAKGGRRRTAQLDLNYGGHFALGVKLMEHHLRATLTDLGTNVIDTLTADVDARVPDQVARAVAGALDTLLDRAGRDRRRMIGIGLAMPGQHDAERGVCLRSDRLGWKDVPIADLIGRLAGVPVWVDNDINAFALAEHLFGAGRNASSLAVFSFGRGVGAAMIVDGQLLRGRFGGAGEIGHMTAVEHGPRCECGKFGCLEAVSSTPAILNAYGMVRPSDRPIEPAALATMASDGDPVAREILETAGRRLGSAAATLATLFDPETMVVGGEGVVFGQALLDPLVATLKEKNFQRETEVFVEFWNDDAWARGAAALAIDSFFSLPN